MDDHDMKMRNIANAMHMDSLEAEVKQSGHKRNQEDLNKRIQSKLEKWEAELGKFD